MNGVLELHKFERLIELTELKRDLDAQLRVVNAELEPLRESLPDVLIEKGITSLPLNGWTLYPSTRWYAGAQDDDPGQERLKSALIEHGFESVVKANTQSLSALWNEFAESDEGVPDWLSSVAKSSPRIKLNARKTSTKKTK